jgi:hypothetical protein
VYQGLSADQQSLVALQTYLCRRCAIEAQVIFLLLGLQAALVKALVLVVVQLELLQVGLGLGWVQNRYQAALLMGVHSVLQPFL